MDLARTRKEAIYLFEPYLKREWLVWDYAQVKGYLTKSIAERDLNVIGSDILDRAILSELDVFHSQMVLIWLENCQNRLPFSCP